MTGVFPSDGALHRSETICNQKGLHARAAAKFVKTVGSFDAHIKVSRCGQTVSGLSIMGLMMLAAATGCDVALTATGPDAEQALNALSELIQDKFGEE